MADKQNWAIDDMNQLAAGARRMLEQNLLQG